MSPSLDYGKNEERIAALHAYNILDTPPEADLGEIRQLGVAPTRWCARSSKDGPSFGWTDG